MKNRLFLLLFCWLQITAIAAQEKIRVACVGNSVTYGTGIKDREHDSYPAQLQRLLGNHYEVRNFGRPCATLIEKGPLPYIQMEEYRKALDFKADCVIIHLGLNDTDPNCWPCYADRFIPDYHALIDTFRIANPKAKIWICRMTPIFHRHKRFECGTRDWHGQIQQKIEQIARTYGVGLIDFFEPLHNRIELFPDALHPNPEGAGILAQKVYGAITGDFGGLQLPATYGEGMVIQREKPIVLTGKADAHEKVMVRFNRKKATTHTAADGTWKVILPPQPAGGPYALTIATPKKEIHIKETWVGEVWLCSGQSNMVFPLQQCQTAKQDLAEAHLQKNLHLFRMEQLVKPAYRPWEPEILDTVNRLGYLRPGEWKSSNAESAAEFSAVAYHFGKLLADSLHCPIGLIFNAAGSAPVESWIDRTTLEYEFPGVLYDWTKNNRIQPGARNLAIANTQKSSNPLQRHFCEPAYLFESGILPLKDFTIRGVIWYQGEANAHNVELYEKLFPLLENSWRKFWNDPQLPFHFVQLSSLSIQRTWPLFRDCQRRLSQQLPHTWMTVSSDLGDSLNIHPWQKAPIGQRLAHSALHHTYLQQSVVPSGPELTGAEYKGKEVRLTFKYGEGLHAADGKTIRGFEVAGADGIYHEAQTKVAGNRLLLQSKKVKDIHAVRYGWEAFTRANLVNSSQMPCSTFRIEKE